MRHVGVWFVFSYLVFQLAFYATAAHGADVTVPGKIHIIKAGTLAKFTLKDTAATFPLPTPGGTADPTFAGSGGKGGQLDIFDTTDGLGLSTTLPVARWLGLGNPPGSKGYKYKGAGTTSDPCKLVLVKSTVIKAVCADDQYLDPALTGSSGIILTLGSGAGTDRYCASFGGLPVVNDPGFFKRKDAPAPASCPTIPPLSTWTIIQAHLGVRCDDCHTTDNKQGLTGLDDYNAGYANTVNVPSSQVPSIDRIEPGNAANSHLMRKLDGTQTSGSRMPPGGPYISQTQRDQIRAWINGGAPKN